MSPPQVEVRQLRQASPPRISPCGGQWILATAATAPAVWSPHAASASRSPRIGGNAVSAAAIARTSAASPLVRGLPSSRGVPSLSAVARGAVGGTVVVVPSAATTAAAQEPLVAPQEVVRITHVPPPTFAAGRPAPSSLNVDGGDVGGSARSWGPPLDANPAGCLAASSRGVPDTGGAGEPSSGTADESPATAATASPARRPVRVVEEHVVTTLSVDMLATESDRQPQMFYIGSVASNLHDGSRISSRRDEAMRPRMLHSQLDTSVSLASTGTATRQSSEVMTGAAEADLSATFGPLSCTSAHAAQVARIAQGIAGAEDLCEADDRAAPGFELLPPEPRPAGDSASSATPPPFPELSCTRPGREASASVAARCDGEFALLTARGSRRVASPPPSCCCADPYEGLHLTPMSNRPFQAISAIARNAHATLLERLTPRARQGLSGLARPSSSWPQA